MNSHRASHHFFLFSPGLVPLLCHVALRGWESKFPVLRVQPECRAGTCGLNGWYTLQTKIKETKPLFPSSCQTSHPFTWASECALSGAFSRHSAFTKLIVNQLQCLKPLGICNFMTETGFFCCFFFFIRLCITVFGLLPHLTLLS